MLTNTELLELNETYANTNIADEGTIREYYDTRTQIEQFTEDIQFVMSHPSHCLSFIQPGRLVHVSIKVSILAGVLLSITKSANPRKILRR